jgi:hypothetical protein
MRATNGIPLGCPLPLTVAIIVNPVQTLKAWFRPDLIDPASTVPTGIGAVAFLDLLQSHLGVDSHKETAERMIALQAVHWPEAKRPFQPIDIEYLSCECRKYYSYINGTKQFEGKNVFTAGKSPMLTFDMPTTAGALLQHSSSTTPSSLATNSMRRDTGIHVIAGGPCSGKTSLLKALTADGYRTYPV